MRRPRLMKRMHWHSMWPAVRTMQSIPFVLVPIALMMVVVVVVVAVAEVLVAAATYLIRNLAVNVVAKSLAKVPYLYCSDCVVDTIEVKLILGRQRQRPQHSDYCRTFVNAVWHVQRMPLHLGPLIATMDYRRTVGTVRSCAVRGAMHQLDLCEIEWKWWRWLDEGKFSVWDSFQMTYEMKEK